MEEIDSQLYENVKIISSKKRKHDDVDSSFKNRKGYTRSVKKHKLLVRNSDGSLRELKPEDTIWYLIYIANPPSGDRMLKLFHNRFRVQKQLE